MNVWHTRDVGVSQAKKVPIEVLPVDKGEATEDDQTGKHLRSWCICWFLLFLFHTPITQSRSIILRYLRREHDIHSHFTYYTQLFVTYAQFFSSMSILQVRKLPISRSSDVTSSAAFLKVTESLRPAK
jgi:hypothetical protein